MENRDTCLKGVQLFAVLRWVFEIDCVRLFFSFQVFFFVLRCIFFFSRTRVKHILLLCRVGLSDGLIKSGSWRKLRSEWRRMRV